jgi:hypothetical protein
MGFRTSTRSQWRKYISWPEELSPTGRALPTTLKAGGIQALRLIAANEVFEVAYFSELLRNISNYVSGSVVEDTDYVVKTLTAIVNVRATPPIIYASINLK